MGNVTRQFLFSIISRNCFVQKTTHDSLNRYLNTNGPLQVGGLSFTEEKFTDFATAALGVPRYIS